MLDDEGKTDCSGCIVIAQPPVISRLANALTAGTDACNLALSCKSAANNIDWLDLLWSIRYNSKKVHCVVEQLPEDICKDISTRRLSDLVDGRYLELWSCPPLLKWFVKLAAQQGDVPFLSALLGRSPWPAPYNRPAAPAPAAASHGNSDVVPMLRLGMQLGTLMNPQEVSAARSEAALRRMTDGSRIKSVSFGSSLTFAIRQIPETSEPVDSQLVVLGYPIEVVHGPGNISGMLGGGGAAAAFYSSRPAGPFDLMAAAATARSTAAIAATSTSDEDDDQDDDNSLHADADSNALDQDDDDAASSRSSPNSFSNRSTHADDLEDTSGAIDGRASDGGKHQGSDSNTSSSNRHNGSSSSDRGLSEATDDDHDEDTYTSMDQGSSSNQAKTSKVDALIDHWWDTVFSYAAAVAGLHYLTGVAAAEAINHGHYQLLKQMKEAGWLEGMEPAHLAPALRAAAAAAAATAAAAVPAASESAISSGVTASNIATAAAAVARLWFQAGAWLGAGAAALGAAAAANVACTAPAVSGAAPEAAAATTRKPAAAAKAAAAHVNALAAAQLLLETSPQLLQISYDTYNQGNYIQKVQLLSLAADLYYSNSFRNIQLRQVAATLVQNPAMMLVDVCRRAQQDPKVVQLLLDLEVCTSMQRVYYVPSDAPCRFDEGFFEYNGPILAAAIAERSSGPVVALMEAGAKLPVPRGKAASQGLGLSSALGVLLGGMIDGLLGPGPLPFDHDDLTAVMDQLRQQQQQVAADDGDGRGSTADGGRYICCCFV